MRWVVIAVLGVAVVAAAVIFQDDIQDAIGGGGDRPETLVYRFDGPVTPAVIERARTLVADRLSTTGAIVRVEGDHLEIDVLDTRTSMEVSMRMADADRLVPRIELRILDYDPEYLTAVKAALRKSARAEELGVEVRLDSFGYHLEAPTGSMYVNTAFAEAHGCPARYRIEGTGISCTVTGADRIHAVLDGDPTLFAEPAAPGVTLAPDRELVVADNGQRARAYVYERAPIVLEASTIASADTRGGVLLLTIAPASRELLRRRVSGPAVELVQLVRGAPSPAKLHPDGTLEIAIDASDARTFVNALSYAHLPQRLREAPMK